VGVRVGGGLWALEWALGRFVGVRVGDHRFPRFVGVRVGVAKLGVVFAGMFGRFFEVCGRFMQ